MNTLASDFVRYADDEKWIGIPYDRWDCQQFVEEMLRGVGVRYNWRGSNHMWREAVTDRREKAVASMIPGEWVFTVKNDGGEKARGYNDDMGNAAHVGIYLGNNRVIHSSAGGVQWGNASDSRWTHSAKCKLLLYDAASEKSDLEELITKIIKTYKEMEGMIDELVRSYGDVD